MELVLLKQDKNTPTHLMEGTDQSPSFKDDDITELEKSDVVKAKSGKQTVLGVRRDVTSELPEIRNVIDIDRQLSELQCPFIWEVPCTGTVPSEMIRILERLINDELKQEVDNYKIRNFLCGVLIAFELHKDGKLEEAYKRLFDVFQCVKEFYEKCEDEFFNKMKEPLWHVILSCKRMLDAEFSKSHKEHKLQEIKENFDTTTKICLQPEMIDCAKACIYGLKAEVFTLYNHADKALECIKKAIDLDPEESEWYAKCGSLMGKIRRHDNWSQFVREEELEYFDKAIKLNRKPLYLVSLADLNIEYTTHLWRNLKKNNETRNLDKEKQEILKKRNTDAKDLLVESVQLKSDCVYFNYSYARGMIKLPRNYMDKDMVDKSIKKTLVKASKSGLVYYSAGVFAEKHKYDIGEALRCYKISSNLGYFKAKLSYIRVSCFQFGRNNDLIGELKNLLDYCSKTFSLSTYWTHLTLVLMGSYYLFLKRDLFGAIDYYSQVMDWNIDTDFITDHFPAFLLMKSPINLYEILYTEVRLKLNINELSTEEKSKLEEILTKLNEINPSISETFSGTSQIDKILNDSEYRIRKWKGKIKREREKSY